MNNKYFLKCNNVPNLAQDTYEKVFIVYLKVDFNQTPQIFIYSSGHPIYHRTLLWKPLNFPCPFSLIPSRTFHLPAEGKRDWGVQAPAARGQKELRSCSQHPQIAWGTHFPMKTIYFNGAWLPSAMGPIVQPYSALNRLLPTGL